jgi:hypothetical protein
MNPNSPRTQPREVPHLRRIPRPLQSPRPALHQLSHRPRVARGLRARRSRKRLRPSRMPRALPVSLYMHLPFCESLCLFCACNVVITKDHSVAPPYLTTLKREIDHVSRFVSRARARRAVPLGRRHAHLPHARADGRPVRLHRGALFLLSRRRDRHRSRPASHHPQHLESLRRLGFNRLSMGIQDFDRKCRKPSIASSPSR